MFWYEFSFAESSRYCQLSTQAVCRQEEMLFLRKEEKSHEKHLLLCQKRLDPVALLLLSQEPPPTFSICKRKISVLWELFLAWLQADSVSYPTKSNFIWIRTQSFSTLNPQAFCLNYGTTTFLVISVNDCLTANTVQQGSEWGCASTFTNPGQHI